jgi:hypothetical protein
MSHFPNPLGYDSSGVSFPMLTKELATIQLAEQPLLRNTADQIKQIPVPETLRRGKTRREKHRVSVAGNSAGLCCGDLPAIEGELRET